MEDVQSVATLLESTTSKIQQLQKAFAELECHRAVTLNLKWKQIEDHFHGLEKSLKRRFTELENQEKEFEIKTNQSQQIMANRQAAVLAKEEACLEKLQEKRDAAVSTILQIDSIVEEKQKQNQKLSENDIKALTNPELAKLCESNDANGLHKFISDNRKNLASIKEEIPIALKAAVNPGGLVLDSLTGFYTIEDGKKDSNLLGQRRTCIMLMECLSILLTNLDEKSVSRVISKDVKERAKVIADEWKLKLDDLDLDASNGNSLEAHAFLQLVATFGIDSDFVDEDLVKLIPMVSRRRQTADLCRFLGLSEKMPGVIDVLVNSGRHIDGVNLAFAFDLTNKFSPVLLLKSYLNLTENDGSLSALKAVIKCIEDHKLEDQYPITPLQKQILNLEKTKADKKRATEPQPKRPRANAIPNYTPRNNNNNIVSAVVSPDKKYYPRYGPPPPQPQPQPQYMYAAYSDNHIPAYMAVAPPNHAHYFATTYQYQAPYLH